MKRIALIRNANSYDFGGAEIFAINLAQELAQNDFTPFILTSHSKIMAASKSLIANTKRSPWWSFQNFSGVRVLLFPVYLLWILYITLWYTAYFLKNHIDIAHPQSRDDFIATTFAAKILGKKVVWTDHADLKYVYMNYKTWYKNPVGKMVYSVSHLASHIMIDSNSEYRLIEESLGKPLPKNYSVVHIGVTDKFKQTKHEKRDQIVFASTSRLVKAKGIAELIEAFKQVTSKNAVLKLYGDGPDAKLFKDSAKGVENIEFLGHVDDIVSVLSNTDVLVHPTHNESFGLSLVEAEMCEIPIIASNVGSIPEIVKDGVSGIVVEVKNVKSLTEAMNKLADDAELRQKMGKAGRQIYLDNFQFDTIVKEKIIPIYEN